MKRQARKELGGTGGREVFQAEGTGGMKFSEMGTSLASRGPERRPLCQGEHPEVRGHVLGRLSGGGSNLFEKIKDRFVIFVKIIC